MYYNYLESLILPDRAAEPERQNILTRAFPYAKHHWTGTRAEVWYLNVVGVDPAFEGQGIGRELVAWGSSARDRKGWVLVVLLRRTGTDSTRPVASMSSVVLLAMRDRIMSCVLR